MFSFPVCGANLLAIEFWKLLQIWLAKLHPDPAFANGEKILGGGKIKHYSSSNQLLGLNKWGDLHYASFRVLPATGLAANGCGTALYK
jgi:hypothetical protein